MKTLTKWTAKRAGGRITIYATDAHGRPVTVTNVDTISGRMMERRGWFVTRPELVVIATHKDGDQYRLA